MSLFNFSYHPQSRSEIEQELQRLNAALDELQRKSGRHSRHYLNALRDQAEALWEGARLAEHGDHVLQSTRLAGQRASACVRRHPLTTAAVALGAVALLGYLVTRR